MAAIERVMRLRSELEARLLWFSLSATVIIAGLGIGLGLMARSPAIVFDWVFTVLDVALTWLTLKVARLVASQGNQRFQFSFTVDPERLSICFTADPERLLYRTGASFEERVSRKIRAISRLVGRKLKTDVR